MRVVVHLADHITVLDRGSLLAEGKPKEIAASEPRCRPLILGYRMTALEATGLKPITARATFCTTSGLDVDEGEIITLLGRNGAGKTTTLA